MDTVIVRSPFSMGKRLSIRGLPAGSRSGDASNGALAIVPGGADLLHYRQTSGLYFGLLEN